MPIMIQCGGCSRRLNAPEQLAGKRVKCPGCSQVLTVPVRGQQTPPPSSSANQPLSKTGAVPQAKKKPRGDQGNASMLPADLLTDLDFDLQKINQGLNSAVSPPVTKEASQSDIIYKAPAIAGIVVAFLNLLVYSFFLFAFINWRFYEKSENLTANAVLIVSCVFAIFSVFIIGGNIHVLLGSRWMIVKKRKGRVFLGLFALFMLPLIYFAQLFPWKSVVDGTSLTWSDLKFATLTTSLQAIYCWPVASWGLVVMLLKRAKEDFASNSQYKADELEAMASELQRQAMKRTGAS